MIRSVNSKTTDKRLVLGINCALHPFGVSLVQVDHDHFHTLIDQTIHTKGSAIEDLVFVLEDICQKNGHQLSDIDIIGLLNGPGTYTAMRLSLTVVKTIAQLYSTTLVGLSSLEHLAWMNRGRPGVYISIFHARADQHNAALFGVEKRKLKRLTDDFLWTEPEILPFFKKQKGSMTCIGTLPDTLVSQLGNFKNIHYMATDIHARYIAHQACEPDYLTQPKPLDIYYPTSI